MTNKNLLYKKPKKTNKQKTQERASVGGDVEKRKPLCTLGGDVNWGQPL